MGFLQKILAIITATVLAMSTCLVYSGNWKCIFKSFFVPLLKELL